MAKPTKPRWADGDPSYVIEPSAGKKDTGWLSTEKPPFQYMNWLHKMNHDWTEWFEANCWSKQDLTLYSSAPISWDGASIVFGSNIQIFLRYESGARRVNQISAGTIALADGQCVVAKFDYTNATPATLVLEGTYGNLGPNEYCVVAESSLTLTDEENERILFRRRGTLLEVVPLGLLIPAPACFNFGSGVFGPDTRHGGAVQTTDATPTPIIAIPLAEGEVVTVEAMVTARKSDGAARESMKVIASFYRNAGGDVTINGASACPFAEPGTYDAEWVANTGDQTVDLQVTGAGGVTLNWTASAVALKAS